MAYLSENYTPNAKSKKLLDAAWRHVKSVPYQVTSRWLFYRLLQDGFYKKKDDYKIYIQLMSRVRHNHYLSWRPDTLVDDRRDPIVRTGGYRTVDDWVKSYTEGGFPCEIDHFYQQDNYVEIWFEAEAMVRQFEYYTQGITLRPFSGMPSISYKYSIAKDLTDLKRTYKKPIVILYFGDYDPAGEIIPQTTVKDIQSWCSVEFDFIRCGLNEGDAERYNLPENFEKPGEYQWEALTDEAAKEIITTAISSYMDTSVIWSVHREGDSAAHKFDEYLSGFSDFYYQDSISDSD